MNVLTITGRKGGNQGTLAKLLAEVLRGHGNLVLVEECGKTKPFHPHRNPLAQVESRRVYLIRTRDR